MKFKNIFLGTLFVSISTIAYVETSAPNQLPIEEMPPLQLPAAAKPSQLPQRTVPVVSSSEAYLALKEKEQAKLIAMLACLSVKK